MRGVPGLAVLLMAGCAVGPNYRRPDVVPVQRFHGEPEAPTPPPSTTLGDLPWWEVFGDPVLQKLLREGIQQNLDLQRVAARVEEARVISRATWWSLFPTLSAELGAIRQNSLIIPPRKSTFNFYSATANVSWELDVWGRIRRSHESARAQYLASEETRRDVLSLLVAEIAQTYFALRSLDDQWEIAREQRDVRLASLRIFEARLESGTGNLAEVANARALVLEAEVAQANVQRQREQTENALSVLLGRPPGRIDRGLPLEAQTLPPDVPSGLPSDLLKRRPDVRQAEQQLVSANAQVGVALAQLLPPITLSGEVGILSPTVSHPLEGGPVWSFGVSAPWTLPFLGADSLRANYQASRARFNQSLAAYEQTVLTALREVSDALVAREQLDQQVRLLEQQVAAVEEQRKMAQLRYQGGVANYLEVTTAESNLLPVKLSLAQTRASLLSAVVQLYRALGGGWQTGVAQPAGSTPPAGPPVKQP